jgi:hypothetical protein
MPFKTYYLTPEGVLRRELNEQQVRAAFESRKILSRAFTLSKRFPAGAARNLGSEVM